MQPPAPTRRVVRALAAAAAALLLAGASALVVHEPRDTGVLDRVLPPPASSPR